MHKRGFTLIEMMVSVAIIAIISAIISYNHSKFNSDLEITNVAYRVALEARQAQVYGISVKQDSSQNFNSAYGLHFNALTSPFNSQFIFFVDTDGDGKYTPADATDSACTAAPGGNECIEQVNLGHGNTITGYCSFWGTSSESHACTPTLSVSNLDILFKRPKPDAVMYAYVGGYSGAPDQTMCGGGQCNGWAICLASPQGRQKQVVILSTGQISVGNAGSGVPGDRCTP